MMVNKEKRPGKAQGAGNYEYPNGSKKYLWPKLRELFPPTSEKLSQQEMIDRLLFVQALETVRCYEERVVTLVADANIGSIFGWGIAPFKGGTLQFINDYGLPAFIGRCGELVKQYGERLTSPELLLSMAREERRF